MFNFPKEIIIILVIVLIIFGPTQLPKLGKMFGKTMKGLRDGMENADVDEPEADAKTADKPKEVKAAEEDAPPPAPKAVAAETEDEDPAAELARLKAENARLAEAAKKAGAKDVE